MPFCETLQFGRIEYDAASRLHFSEGLPAFESERDFVLIQRAEQKKPTDGFHVPVVVTKLEFAATTYGVKSGFVEKHARIAGEMVDRGWTWDDS